MVASRYDYVTITHLAIMDEVSSTSLIECDRHAGRRTNTSGRFIPHCIVFVTVEKQTQSCRRRVMSTRSHVDAESRRHGVTSTRSHVDAESRRRRVTSARSHVDAESRRHGVTSTESRRQSHVDRVMLTSLSQVRA